jgi:hypothetical protein
MVEFERENGDIRVELVRAEKGFYIYVTNKHDQNKSFILNTKCPKRALEMFNHPYIYTYQEVA